MFVLGESDTRWSHSALVFRASGVSKMKSMEKWITEVKAKGGGFKSKDNAEVEQPSVAQC